MKLVPVCCDHPDHQNPHVNEDGWILTGLPDDESTWEAHLPGEWEMHCAHAEGERRRAARKREAYRRRRDEVGRVPVYRRSA